MGKRGRPPITDLCGIGGCERVGNGGRRLCNMHYQRWKSHGDPNVLVRHPAAGLVCRSAECGRPARMKGQCQRCWARDYRRHHPKAHMTVRSFTCVHCSTEFESIRARRYCSKRCSIRAGAQRQDRRIRGRQAVSGALGKKVRVDKAAIGERDGWICHLCHEAIDWTLEWPNQRMATLDHLTPLAGGGTHDPTNVAIAHFDCNMRRGTNAVDTMPRDWPIELGHRPNGTGSVYRRPGSMRWEGYARIGGRKVYVPKRDTAAEVEALVNDLLALT